MSLSALYILFVLVSIFLFNALIMLARSIQQAKKAPVEEDYDRLEKQRADLERTIEQQNTEIVELQLKVKSLEEAPASTSPKTAKTEEPETKSA